MAKFHFPDGKTIECLDKDAPKLARIHIRFYAATLEASPEVVEAVKANLEGMEVPLYGETDTQKAAREKKEAEDAAAAKAAQEKADKEAEEARIAAEKEAKLGDLPTDEELSTWTKVPCQEYALKKFQVELKGNADEVKAALKQLVVDARAKLQ